MSAHPALGVFIIVTSLMTSRATAEMLSSTYLRALSVSTDTIVVARPVEGRSLPEDRSHRRSEASAFVVEEVLKGDGKLASQTITVDDRGLFVLGSRFFQQGSTKIQSALLFLSPPKGALWPLDYLYVNTPEDTVVRPVQLMNPGPYVLAEEVQLSWKETKRIVQTFLPQVEALRALRSISDPSSRNKRLFAWVNEHEDEFHGGALLGPYNRSLEPRKGWGMLEHEIFQWILDGDIPTDSWLALQRHADVMQWKENHWALTEHTSHFSHDSGRSFLLEKLTDEKQPLIARRTAAIELNHALNPGRAAEEKHPHLKAVSLKGQEDIIRAVSPLAGHDDTILRRAVLGLLLDASDPFNDTNRPQRTKLAFPVIGKALLVEHDREILADQPESLNHLMDESEWLVLTGNPGRICVTVSCSLHENVLKITSHAKHLPDGAMLPVDLILERLNDQGEVAETVTRKLTSANGKPWPPEWQGFVTLEDVSTEGLSAGLWKIRLKGVSADQRKLSWTSWHNCFRIR